MSIGGYAVLARMADKGRATLSGTAGEYHFNCPLDNMLFSFKGVQAEDVKNLLASGATDEQIAAWFDENGIPKTADEIKAWSDSVEAIRPYENPEQRDCFALIPTIELNHTETSDLPFMQNESAYAAVPETSREDSRFDILLVSSRTCCISSPSFGWTRIALSATGIASIQDISLRRTTYTRPS